VVLLSVAVDVVDVFVVDASVVDVSAVGGSVSVRVLLVREVVESTWRPEKAMLGQEPP
jgi:hypothetical protein